LGLAITSQLVQLMGGRIWVDSAPGHGSTFHFTGRFSLHDEAKGAPPPGGPVDLRDLPVLVVDDNATNRRILEEMLINWQMKPTLVEGSAKALAELERAAAEGEPYALVLVDACMPEVDGFTLSARIREHPELLGATIMMLSSADLQGGVARCQELGI